MKKVFFCFCFVLCSLLVSAGSEITYSLTVNQGEEEVSTYIPPMIHQFYNVAWILIPVFFVLLGARLMFYKKVFKKTVKKKTQRRTRKKRK
ncbi:hypothetical protein HNV12_00815 [Methanococcoides sp. SA1]|nr:hypothetical protein [Methanococcoides sp. SA1]